MEYKLFGDYITLQSLLKASGILYSGGAIKSYLLENTVLFNGEKEERRGKKLRVGDQIQLVEKGLTITIVEPSQEEKEEHQGDLAEKERVAKIVKEMNKGLKKKPTQATAAKANKRERAPKKQPVRFPGT